MKAKPLNLALIQSWLPKRSPDTYKGLCGHVVVIGGDHGMPGSVRLTAEGAARVGAGLVSVITRKSHLSTTLAGRPELMGYGIESNLNLLHALIKKATVIVLGPGLGQSAWSKRLFDAVMTTHHATPLIIDADGLNWLASQDMAPRDNWILTPHPGEAARLLNASILSLQHDRQGSAAQLQQKFGGVCVLKGHHTLIADPHQVHVCIAGNPGMASAGMGDLLSGIIAGLLAQQIDPWQAACAGVLVHATAADRVAENQGERGLIASDLFVELPRLIN